MKKYICLREQDGLEITEKGIKVYTQAIQKFDNGKEIKYKHGEFIK